MINSSKISSIASETPKKIKSEFDPNALLTKYNSKFTKLYESPSYKALKPETRQKLNDALYDKILTKVGKRVGQDIIPKMYWSQMTDENRMFYVRGLKPNPAINWNSYEIKDAMKPSFMSQSPADLETTMKAGALNMASETWKIIGATLKLGTGLVRKSAQVEGSFLGDNGIDKINKDSFQKIIKGTETIENTFDKFIKLSGGNEELQKLQPAVNKRMSSRLVQGSMGFIPDLIALEFSPGGKIGTVDKVEKGVFKLSGIISQFGGLSKYLESTGTGRTLVRMAHGAIDGYYLASATGDKDKVSSATGWAIMEGGIPGLTKATSTLYSKLGNIFGGDVIKAGVFNTLKELPQHTNVPGWEGVAINDPLIRKLNVINHNVLQNFSRTFYGTQYQFLKPKQVREVNKEINKAIANGYKYPAIFDEISTAHDIEKQVNSEIRSVSEVSKSLQRLKEISKETTGKETFTGAVEKIKSDTKAAANLKPSVRQNADILESLGKNEKQKQLPPASSTVSVPMDAPGAAKKTSPAFTEETFLKALSLNKFIEKPEDRLVIEYWKARTGRLPKSMADKFIKAYESQFPDETYRIGREAGLVEHYQKLFRTGHLMGEGSKGNIYRSGKYIADEMRKDYKMPKTKWQRQLDREDR